MKYKNEATYHIYDEKYRSKILLNSNNILVKLNNLIDFEIFRENLEKSLTKGDKKATGARSFDPVLMLKILILQSLFSLSDDQTEYQINDRVTFRMFLGLGLEQDGKIPDAKTIWNFRNKLKDNNVLDSIFDKFNKLLENKGVIQKKGIIVDASFITVPRQRNTKEENEIIKEDKGSTLWNDNKNKKCQKDVDARWTKKNNENFFGYKDHIKIDSESKIITNFTVTSASVHDSQALEALVKDSDAHQTLHADSAYTGEKQTKILTSKKIINQVLKKAARNNPLSDKDKLQNKEKSKVRSRVEHVFGFMTNTMKAMHLRFIGIKSVNIAICLINLTYNFCRYTQIMRK